MTNQRVISTIAAAVLTAAFAAPRTSAQDVLVRCNAPIADVETIASRVSDCRAWIAKARLAERASIGPAGPKTPAPVIPKTVPKPPAVPAASLAAPKRPTPAETAAAEKARAGGQRHMVQNMIPPIEPVVFRSTVFIPIEITKAALAEPATVERLDLYFAYEAFSAGDAGRCKSMTFVTTAIACRELFDELNFARSRLGPREEFLKGCLSRGGLSVRLVSPEKLPAWCALIADNAENPAALCAKLMPLLDPVDGEDTARPTDAECRATFASLRGDDSACGAVPRDNREACKGDALFAKAFKAKNVSLCAGSQRCRVLMGEGRAVLKEMEPTFTTPVGKWVMKKGWNVQERLPPPDRKPAPLIRTPGDPMVEAPVKPVAHVPTPGDPTVRPPAPEAPKPPEPGAGPRDLAASVPAPYKGFVCAEPLWSEANRKAAAAAVKAAHLCLSDIESVAKPNAALTRGLDERLERLARLSLKINDAFDPAGGVKKSKAPAQPAPPKQP